MKSIKRTIISFSVINSHFLMVYRNRSNTPIFKEITSKDYILDTLGVKEDTNFIGIASGKYGFTTLRKIQY